MQKTLGELIARERKSKKLNQLDFAEKAGLSKSYIAKIEIDLMVPSPKNFISILENLNVDTKELTELLRAFDNIVSKNDSEEFAKNFFSNQKAIELFDSLLEDSPVYSEFHTTKFIHYHIDVKRTFIMTTMRFLDKLNYKVKFSNSSSRIALLLDAIAIFNANFDFISFFDISPNFESVMYRTLPQAIITPAESVTTDTGKTSYDFEVICSEVYGIDPVNPSYQDICKAVDEKLIDIDLLIDAIIDEIPNKIPTELTTSSLKTGNFYKNQIRSFFICYLNKDLLSLTKKQQLEQDPLEIKLSEILQTLSKQKDSKKASITYKFIHDTFDYIKNNLD